MIATDAMSATLSATLPVLAARLAQELGTRSIVLVGMPGSGKSTIGKRLAHVLGLPFVDADAEIERAAAMTIPEIFTTYGEAEFREGEKRVVARLLEPGGRVIATGGGAFMAAETRAAIAARGISVWLRADLDTLVARVRRKNNRPLLQGGDAREKLAALLAQREPVFAAADVTVASRDVTHDTTVAEIVRAVLALPPRPDGAGAGIGTGGGANVATGVAPEGARVANDATTDATTEMAAGSGSGPEIEGGRG